ncbi:hypothetical protein [Novipirellula caenicola]|uniref:Pycsar effector protein domain-containing protein n=1 Tax=Novipirellula caenicola TaxID=1536901 RepID=A0ABP9VJM0_9BACT
MSQSLNESSNESSAAADDASRKTPLAEASASSSASTMRPRLDDDTQNALEAENLIETYQIIGEWIRFADAKAAAVLAVNGALCGVLVPTIHEYIRADQSHPAWWWTSLVSATFLLWLASMIWSCVLAFRCILPFRYQGKHPSLGRANHFHPAAISAHYTIDQTEQFADEMQRIGMSGLKREIAICMMLDSHVSNSKYTFVSRSIRMLALSAILGLMYLIVTQF